MGHDRLLLSEKDRLTPEIATEAIHTYTQKLTASGGVQKLGGSHCSEDAETERFGL